MLIKLLSGILFFSPLIAYYYVNQLDFVEESKEFIKKSNEEFLDYLIERNINNEMKATTGTFKYIGVIGKHLSGKHTMAKFAEEHLNFNYIDVEDILKICGYIYFNIFLVIYTKKNTSDKFILRDQFYDFIKKINFYVVRNKIYIFNNLPFDLSNPDIIKNGEMFKKWKNYINYVTLIKNFKCDNHLIVLNYKSFNYTFHIKRRFKKRLKYFDESREDLQIYDLKFDKLMQGYSMEEFIPIYNNYSLDTLKNITILFLKQVGRDEIIEPSIYEKFIKKNN